MITAGKHNLYKKGGGKTIRMKLGDVYEGFFWKKQKRVDQYKAGELQHLKKCWDTLDLTDAMMFVSLHFKGSTTDSDQSKNMILPQAMIRYNNFKLGKRNKKKAENYLKVITSMKKNGYDPEKFRSGHIKIMKNGMLVDGNHRFDALLARYGEDHEIEFYKVGMFTHITLRIMTSVVMAGFWVFFIGMVLWKVVWTILITIPFWIVRKFWKLTFGRLFQRRNSA